MHFPLSLLATSLLVSAAASAASPQQGWRIYRAEEEQAEVCYPAGLLRIHHDKHEWANSWLVGADNGVVFVEARSEKYTTLKDELNFSLARDTQPDAKPAKIWGDPATPDYTFTVKITHSIAKSDWYQYTGENRRFVIYVWRHYVDHAFKGLYIMYPKSRASLWKNVPERMRACFKSLGPIKDPNFQ